MLFDACTGVYQSSDIVSISDVRDMWWLELSGEPFFICAVISLRAHYSIFGLKDLIYLADAKIKHMNETPTMVVNYSDTHM